MTKSRMKYLTAIILTIVAGLFSRRFPSVPQATGDLLWAVMVYFGIRFLFFRHGSGTAVYMSLLICLAVEMSQLYRAPWINSVRSTLPGKLILGQGFLWSDLVAYTVGVFLAYAIDRFLWRGRIPGSTV